jgi:hypothetical protein
MILRGYLPGVLFLVIAASAKSAVASEAPAPHWVIDLQTGCYVYQTDAHPADAVSWSGGCVDRAASGEGTAIFTQAGRFVESVSGAFGHGAAQGAVRVNWADGAHYEGRVASGRFSGPGVLTTAAGDRFEGEWSNAGRGKGVIAWAHGEGYEGAWKNGLPNGAGVLTRRDGSRVEGEFADGVLKPVQPVQAAATFALAAPPIAAAAQKSFVLSPWLADMARRTFVAADGSSFRLNAGDTAAAMEITSANGAVQKTEFRFLNGNQGTIATSQHSDAVLGTFRVSDSGLLAEYADGRTDRLWANASGVLAWSSTLPDGRSFCSRWYPEGHAFSRTEREAALNEYAKQLGIKRKAVESQDCIAVAQAPAAARAADGDHPSRVAATNIPKTAFAPPALSDEPIQVRTATVQTIDPPSQSSPAETPRETAMWPADPGARAPTGPQSCLSIEREDGNWGFRNACGYVVQFAYCVEGIASRSCDAGAHSGAVRANAFAELFPESEVGTVEYGFRWITCKGSAEVEPRLLRPNPPTGQCLKRPGGSILLAAKTHQ